MYLNKNQKIISLTKTQYEELKKSGQLIVGVQLDIKDSTMTYCSFGAVYYAYPPDTTFLKRIKWLMTGKIT